ncbi:hypothetical protein [Kordiimonas sp.]|uniref:hypothetical protein n=1 Tax=Kordiimonas sp. TaxID=1970157 RepID=UPI003A93285B
MSATLQTYYRWRSVRRDEDRSGTKLERKNARLKKTVTELTLDKLTLKETAEGNYQTPLLSGDVLTM